jgi:transposase-like protein
MYHNYPSDSSVYGWITKFSEVAIKETEKQKPEVGDVWVADETVLKIEGKNTWFWDIIDAKTRFLLASHISTTRTTRDARKLMVKAAERAGKAPKIVLTDKLRAYLDGVELAYGSETKHVQTKPFTVQDNTNLIERFHGTLKDRTKVMRGLKSRESAKLLTEGWLVHYNFFRPHETLKGKTPAEKAGLAFPYKNWLDITKSPIVTYISEKPRTIRMRLPTAKVKPMSVKPPRAQGRKPRGDIYTGHGMISRRPFSGAKRHKGRII